MRNLWARLDRPSQVSLIVGVVLAVAAIPLPTLLALLVGLGSAAVLGYSFPASATRVGVLVAVPILTVAFIVGFVRGFSVLVLIVFLACSLVLPVGLARIGAAVREGKATT